MSNWNLYYKQSDDKKMQFAELLIRDGECSLRKGAVFTSGSVSKIKSFESTVSDLLDNGYELQREWIFHREKRDYKLFENEIRSVISADPAYADSNALAIITDSSVMTVGFALNKFKDIDSTNDEQLWIVDEWGDWNKNWQLDPAYRWLLAYGFNDELDDECFDEFRDQILKTFQAVLKSCAMSKDILLIYIGGDNWGHQLSVECMDEKLATRLIEWI